jgi:methyl-accepting chemotaxis protein
MSEDLGSTAGSMNSAASQVSSSAQELSSGASQLASSVEEMTSSMEELQSTIENNTKNIREAENIMDQTIKGTEDVTSRMEKMRSAMGEINQHSKQIEKIIKVIDDIAFQTNILALNAAVEAARAGDAGRGFVVVADQVKSLAQKSAEAAKETADLIEKAIRSINEGESTTDEVLNSQSNAKELAEKVSNLLDEVTKASQEQLKGANQVTQGISQINNVVQQTASSSEELASSGEEMLSQSEMMENIVFKLNELVQGEGKVERKQPQKKKTQRQSQPSGPQNTGGSGQKNPSSNGGPKKQPQKQKVDLVRPEDQIPLEDFEDF